jgi:hypothetical protein
MSHVRLAAAGTGFAVVLAFTTAQAADPHPARSKAASRHTSETGTRRSIAGAPTADETSSGVETPELPPLRRRKGVPGRANCRS